MTPRDRLTADPPADRTQFTTSTAVAAATCRGPGVRIGAVRAMTRSEVASPPPRLPGGRLAEFNLPAARGVALAGGAEPSSPTGHWRRPGRVLGEHTGRWIRWAGED